MRPLVCMRPVAGAGVLVGSQAEIVEMPSRRTVAPTRSQGLQAAECSTWNSQRFSLRAGTSSQHHALAAISATLSISAVRGRQLRPISHSPETLRDIGFDVEPSVASSFSAHAVVPHRCRLRKETQGVGVSRLDAPATSCKEAADDPSA
jgi:hypothetical protein